MKTAVALFSSAVLLACSAFAAGEGQKAPELAFTIPSQGQKLLSQYRGKVVALEFIFTTCPHCQAASRVMTRFQKEYGPRGLQVLDIAVNDNADLLVDNFVREYQVGFPVGWTPRTQMTDFMGFNDGRFVVPQLVLIDRKGIIRHKTPAQENDDWDKLMKEENIRQHIEELLGSDGPTARRTTTAGTRAALAKK